MRLWDIFLIFRVPEVIRITCNMGSSVALGLWAYISGKSLLPMLQLIHVQAHVCMDMLTHLHRE